MPNTKFKVEGHVFRHNTPTRKIFGGKEYYLNFEGTKTDCEESAEPLKKKGHSIRIVKTPKGYEPVKDILHPKRKFPYALYVRLSTWKD